MKVQVYTKIHSCNGAWSEKMSMWGHDDVEQQACTVHGGNIWVRWALKTWVSLVN